MFERLIARADTENHVLNRHDNSLRDSGRSLVDTGIAYEGTGYAHHTQNLDPLMDRRCGSDLRPPARDGADRFAALVV